MRLLFSLMFTIACCLADQCIRLVIPDEHMYTGLGLGLGLRLGFGLDSVSGW